MQIVYIDKNNAGDEQKKIIYVKMRNEFLIFLDPVSHEELHQLPLGSTVFSLGGNNDRLIFIKSPQLGGDAAYFELNAENKKFIKSNVLLKQKLAFALDKQNTNFNLAMAVILFFGLTIFSMFYFRSTILGSLTFMIPFEVEKKIGDQLFNPVLTEGQKKTLQTLGPLLDQIKFDKEDWPYALNYHISSETIPNASATLGGHIFINKGLIQLLNQSEDLLGVVAHEMIHIQRRHVAKSTIQVLGIYSVMSLFLGDITGIVAVLADQGAPILSLSYSRSLEEEADQAGVELLIQNKIDPRGLPRALKKINEETQKLIKQSPASEVLQKIRKVEILSSHPDIDQRVNKLENLIKNKMGDKEFYKIKYDYKVFQKAVHNTF